MWCKHRLVFQLLSPLHVGAGRVGNLQRTRRYVPGKLLWAALTARLTRNKGPASGFDYVEMGKRVSAAFRFGYLYPALLSGSDYAVFHPWDPEFDYRFLGSYASTALTEDNAGAEDGSLHETEFIRYHATPLTAGEVPRQVFLSGSLWVFGNGVDGWKDALRRVSIGGERGYGWGRMILADATAGPAEEPRIRLGGKNGERRVLAHVTADSAQGQLWGPIEPLLGWERNNEGGSPWRVSAPRFCFQPGSEAPKDSEFTIGEFGIWEKVP